MNYGNEMERRLVEQAGNIQEPEEPTIVYSEIIDDVTYEIEKAYSNMSDNPYYTIYVNNYNMVGWEYDSEEKAMSQIEFLTEFKTILEKK